MEELGSGGAALKHPPLLLLYSMGGGTQTLITFDRSRGENHEERSRVLPTGEIAAFCRKHMLYFARSRIALAAFDIAASDDNGQIMFTLKYDFVPPMKADLDRVVPKIMAYRRKLAQRR